MKLYNTSSKQIEEITPQADNKITVYTCGPTVYDNPHIGNWFTFIRYDVLVRALRGAGLHVDWVMNITDVGHLVSDADDGEDKLEKGAKREGKTAWDVAKIYGDYFVDGLQRLNISDPTVLPKATDHIKEQIELVKELEKKGHTYTISDGVYFDTSTFKDYGKLAQLDLEEQQAGARVEYNPEKHNSSDFALWKFSPQGTTRDMEWESPWGTGFPGWHLECSAMSMKYLGETVDIHSGGIDHIPVHHTNEIAQSEAATGKPYVRYWMHTNHIMVTGEKISKSLGNSITLEDIEAKGFTLEDFRLHVLESHYRTQSQFSWDSLEAARNRLKDLKALAALQYQTIPALHDHSTFEFSDVVLELQNILEQDLHTEACLTYLSEVTKQTLVVLVSDEEKESFGAMITAIDSLLGTRLSDIADISDDQKSRIGEREQARLQNDWTKSDDIRDALASEGLGLRDTSYGTIWYPL
jgi:cysteinyl-tRNA synthetase